MSKEILGVTFEDYCAAIGAMQQNISMEEITNRLNISLMQWATLAEFFSPEIGINTEVYLKYSANPALSPKFSQAIKPKNTEHSSALMDDVFLFQEILAAQEIGLLYGIYQDEIFKKYDITADDFRASMTKHLAEIPHFSPEKNKELILHKETKKVELNLIFAQEKGEIPETDISIDGMERKMAWNNTFAKHLDACIDLIMVRGGINKTKWTAEQIKMVIREDHDRAMDLGLRSDDIFYYLMLCYAHDRDLYKNEDIISYLKAHKDLPDNKKIHSMCTYFHEHKVGIDFAKIWFDEHEEAILHQLSEEAAKNNDNKYIVKDLKKHTQEGFELSRTYKIAAPNDILQFLILRHQLGDDFAEYPEVKDFLLHQDLKFGHHIEQMMLHFPLEIWSSIKN